MSANLFLNWALKVEPKKEHVSFVNFVRKFDFTERDVAHEAYLSLIGSQHIRQCRRKQLHEAYNSFRARNEEGFWAERALLVSSANAAKKSVVMIQEAGLLEAGSGLQRYPSDLNSNVTHLNIEVETEAEDTCKITDKIITVGGQSKIPADREQDEDPAEVDVTDEELSHAKLTPSMTWSSVVLLSGIINTLSPGVQAFTLSPKIKSESLVPSLSSRLPTIESLLSELLLALCPGLDKDPYAEATLTGLQVKVWELLGNSARETGIKSREQKAVHAVLMVVSHICSLLATEQFAPPTSEHVFVSAWTHILNVLFYDSKIRAIPNALTRQLEVAA
ncbi:hypothetical protein BGW39_002972 [Mortierella sp. 14UC]|nr:hypothetical protein BGW39_002972 [Mortierella sp. 14UC]